jgi:serine/threonine protein kinase/Tfp pilus assembly protein PilF
MMRCPRCQFENLPGTRFCSKCSAPLDLSGKGINPETRTLRPLDKDSIPGTMIAEKYKLLEELGHGGMGAVFRAEQVQPIRRDVALKIIKLGMDTSQVVARFEAERQALAVMDHPNIARVFDAGATQTGRPFFVMELVHGIPVNDYCDRHKLSTKERLELFVAICQAVQHAHQKGIIHRDLKPSNILVAIQDGQPVPKIIDFGIAKATSHHLIERTLFTEQGQLIGTPEYMSPEQAEMSGLDIDTRTDIYSLGVILYELLAGALPFDAAKLRSAGFMEIQRIIRESDPPKASTRLSALKNTQAEIAEKRKTDPGSLLKQLRGDLDWITMKAMAKDRTYRYASASELVADIGKHLRDEPVSAGPPSVPYRLRKFVRRHRIGVIAGALVLFALIAGVTGTTMGIIKARKAEQKAKNEAAKTEAINSYLLEVLGSANPIEGKGRDITVLEALKTAVMKIPDKFGQQPEIAATLKFTIGTTYLRLGYYREAEDLLRSSLSTFEGLGESYERDLAAPLTALGVLRHERGDYAEAEALYRRALPILDRQSGKESPETMNLLNNLALLLQDQGKLDEAESFFRRILETDRKLDANNQVNIATDLSQIGYLLVSKKDYEAAEPYLREAVDMLRKEKHPWLAIILGNLGELLTAKGDYANAEATFTEALNLGFKALGEKNQDVAKIRSKYGVCLVKLKKFDEAEKQLLIALPILRDTAGDKDEVTQKAIRRLLELYQEWGKPDQAAKYRALLIDRGP